MNTGLFDGIQSGQRFTALGAGALLAVVLGVIALQQWSGYVRYERYKRLERNRLDAKVAVLQLSWRTRIELVRAAQRAAETEARATAPVLGALALEGE